MTAVGGAADADTPTSPIGVAVPAAGAGRRLGGWKKPFLELEGEPVLLRALRPFLGHPDVVAVRVALTTDDAADPPPWLRDLAPRVQTVVGGASRADSVRAAVEALPSEVEIVVVHDAARPLVDRELLDRCLVVAREGVGAVAGLPAVDTLKEVDEDGRVVGSPDRSRIWHAQTPQVFPRSILERAFREAGTSPAVTDDAGLVELIGAPVRMVRGSPRNVKITRPEDLAVAALHLRPAASAARVLEVRGRVPSPDELAPVLSHLRGGGLVAYPTETVYGFGGLAGEGPVGALRRLKGREEGRPFLVLLPEAGAAEGLRWSAAARELARRFWPGAVTLVLPDPDGIFPSGVRSPEGSVAVRVSPHPVTRALVEGAGEPVTSTSANVPGGEPALSGDDVLRTVEALGGGGGIWVLDHGRLPRSAPSTLVDCTGAVPRVLREGAVPATRIDRVLEVLDVEA